MARTGATEHSQKTCKSECDPVMLSTCDKSVAKLQIEAFRRRRVHTDLGDRIRRVHVRRTGSVGPSWRRRDPHTTWELAIVPASTLRRYAAAVTGNQFAGCQEPRRSTRTYILFFLFLIACDLSRSWRCIKTKSRLLGPIDVETAKRRHAVTILRPTSPAYRLS
jgi:hypothetical protein